jgi:hypothetical protein
MKKAGEAVTELSVDLEAARPCVHNSSHATYTHDARHDTHGTHDTHDTHHTLHTDHLLCTTG